MPSTSASDSSAVQTLGSSFSSERFEATDPSPSPAEALAAALAAFSASRAARFAASSAFFAAFSSAFRSASSIFSRSLRVAMARDHALGGADKFKKQRRFLGGAVPRSGGRRATPEEVRRVADVLFDADRPRSGSRETSRALCLDAVPRLGRAGGSVLTVGTGTPSGANNLGLCQQTTRKMHVPIASRSAWDTHACAHARRRHVIEAFAMPSS